jgi:hypothetical protein
MARIERQARRYPAAMIRHPHPPAGEAAAARGMRRLAAQPASPAAGA